VLGTRTNHFPFSDHDIIITKLKTEGINRGPGMWIMNLERSVEKSFDILSKYEKHPDQELIMVKQKLFLLVLPAIENQNLIKYHGSKKM
jgi:hypothetical protein